jgi:hypothetical protein
MMARDGGPNGIRTRVFGLRARCPRPLDDGAVARRRYRSAVPAGRENGWGRRIRTPATWSRATRPTTRRSPNAGLAASRYGTTAPKSTIAPRPSQRQAVAGPLGWPSERSPRAAGLPDRVPQGSARTKPRHLRRRNRDCRSGPGIAAIARRSPCHDERAEPADRDALAAAERLDDAQDERSHRAFGRGLGSPSGLRHDGDEVGFGHFFYWKGPDSTRSRPTMSNDPTGPTGRHRVAGDPVDGGRPGSTRSGRLASWRQWHWPC